MAQPDGNKPVIGDRVEAVLCVAWYWLLPIGFLLGTFVSPIGWWLCVLSPVAVALLLRRVGSRLEVPRERRRVLRFWLGQKAQYQAWRVLAGKPSQ
jgi:hypothetical protein